jgi:hypothetical protein
MVLMKFFQKLSSRTERLSPFFYWKWPKGGSAARRTRVAVRKSPHHSCRFVRDTDF